jgi:hypothetical protein
MRVVPSAPRRRTMRRSHPPPPRTWNVHRKHIPGCTQRARTVAHPDRCPANVTCSCPGAWMVYGWITVLCLCVQPPPPPCPPATLPLQPLRCNASAADPPLHRAVRAPRAAQCSLGGCLVLGSAHNSVALTTAWSSRGDGAHVGAKDELLRNLLEAR